MVHCLLHNHKQAPALVSKLYVRGDHAGYAESSERKSVNTRCCCCKAPAGFRCSLHMHPGSLHKPREGFMLAQSAKQRVILCSLLRMARGRCRHYFISIAEKDRMVAWREGKCARAELEVLTCVG